MPLTLLPAVDPRGLKAVAPPVAETNLDRLLKLIPSEVLVAYPAVVALGAPSAWPYYELALLLTGLLVVNLSLHRDGKTSKLIPDWRQYLVRSLAFVAWALVISSPLAPFADWINTDDVRWVASFAAVGIPVVGYLLLPRETS
jgi:hypothetical protein